MVFKQPTSKHWWYKFVWNGKLIRESTKQTNKRTAQTMEDARRTALAKGEVGIRDLKPSPSLKEFVKNDFRPFVERQFAEKAKTRLYYEYGLSNLLAHRPLADAKLDEISADLIGGFVAWQQGRELSVCTINRNLQCLRRILKLATEWKTIRAADSAVKMLPGEQRKDRVLSAGEEAKYFKAASAIGDDILKAYRKALEGIRATQRDQKPTEPTDPYLLYDVTTVLIECALRPEEAYRLKWTEIRDGAVCISHGKTDAARRTIPLSPRATAILDGRRKAALSPEWVFPASTKSGHIDPSTLKKRHAAACKAAEVEHFPLYTFRHTCLTRWSSTMDPYVLAYVAGHANFATTKRYVHPQAHTILAAMAKAREVQGGTKNGHTDENEVQDTSSPLPAIN
jgi:integrase